MVCIRFVYVFLIFIEDVQIKKNQQQTADQLMTVSVVVKIKTSNKLVYLFMSVRRLDKMIKMGNQGRKLIGFSKGKPLKTKTMFGKREEQEKDIFSIDS